MGNASDKNKRHLTLNTRNQTIDKLSRCENSGIPSCTQSFDFSRCGTELFPKIQVLKSDDPGHIARSAYYKKIGIKRNLKVPKIIKPKSEVPPGFIKPLMSSRNLNFIESSNLEDDEDCCIFKPKSFRTTSEILKPPTNNTIANSCPSEGLTNYLEPEDKAEDETSSCDKSQEQSIESEEKVFDSFSMPDIKDFKLDFRNKIIANRDVSHQNIRKKYLDKLTQKKVWLLPSEKPKPCQTCIIFDWDDTLICTYYLNPNGYDEDEPIPKCFYPILKSLEEASYNILSKAIERGKVFIITNASDGWVQFSSKKYMPKVSTLLPKITVISARSNYESKFPGNTFKWKLSAFIDTIKELELESVTNLVALGDSNIEMEASKRLAHILPKAMLKTVKFKERPSPDELIKELTIVGDRLDIILDDVKNLTIRLEKREHENAKALKDQA